jgi:exodeoxyribonuclease VII large subunit
VADTADDLRAPTPTAAAELVAATRAADLAVLDALEQTLARRLRQALDTHAQRIDRLTLLLARPSQLVHWQAQRLALLQHRMTGLMPHTLQAQRAGLARDEAQLHRSLRVYLADADRRLANLAARLRAVDPKQVLARGYAWLADDAGHAVISTRQLAVGAALHAVLSDGEAGVVVTQVSGRTPA